MWFKNLMIYRLTSPFTTPLDELENQLASHAFSPCSRQDKTKIGWISPISSNRSSLIHIYQEHILLCMQKEEKILPASVIKQALDNKIEQLESIQKRKLKKIEKTSLKENVLQSLLPQAFSRFYKTWIWVNTKENLVITNCASSKKSEDALALFRKCLGSLPTVPINSQKPIKAMLTNWVHSGILPSGFSLLDEIELKGNEQEGGVVRCKHVDLASDEIINHLSTGKVVTKLALDWCEKICFIINEAVSFKRVKFSEKLLEENENIDIDDPAQRFDADFILMTAELTMLIKSLMATLEENGEIAKTN